MIFTVSAPRRSAVRAASIATLPGAHHAHVFAVNDRRGAVGVVRLHQIDAGQKLVGGQNAVQVLALDAHKHRKSRARADKDRVVRVDKLLYGDRLAGHAVKLDMYALLFELIDFGGDETLGQTEFGYTVHEHAARTVERLVHGDFHAGRRQFAGAR